jgi:hypothetical protein
VRDLIWVAAALLTMAAINQARNPDPGYSSPPDTATTTVTPSGHATIKWQEGAP